MKKRFLIPAVAAVSIAVLAGLATYGRRIQATCVPGNADYEAGTGICSARNAQAHAAAQTKAASAAPAANVQAAQPSVIGALAKESELMGTAPTDPAALLRWLERQCEITLEMQEASGNTLSAKQMGRKPYCTVLAEYKDDLRSNGVDPDSL
jgi:hypothetical protein